VSHRVRGRRPAWPAAVALAAVATGALAATLALQEGSPRTPGPAGPSGQAAAPSPASPPPVPTPPSGGAPTTVPAGTSPASSPPAGTGVLAEQFGQGDGQVGPFGAPGPWTLSWTYDCSGSGGHGSFSVLVSSGSAAYPPVRSSGVHATGQASYPAGQAFRLSVQTTCAWTVRAALGPG
jgi:hypothetical protein